MLMIIFKSPRIFSFSCLLLVIISIVGCSSYGPTFDPRASTPLSTNIATNQFSTVQVAEKLPREWLQPPQEPYRLGPGDEVVIELVNMKTDSTSSSAIPENVPSTIITPDGKLYFQNLNGIRVVGMTLPEVKAILERELASLYREPQVGISLTQIRSRRFWMMGRVTNPGVYSLSHPTTVLEAISLAGGILGSGDVKEPTPFLSGTVDRRDLSPQDMESLSDLSRAFFIRDGKFIPIDFMGLLYEGRMENNIFLENGDYIYIPVAAAKEVYVLGAVRQPKVIQYHKPVSLISAITIANGPTATAHIQHIVIIRGSLTQPRVAVVAYKDIVTGKASDILLEPNDIVWVPRSPWERLDRLVNQIVSTFARTVAANEGIQFVRPSAERIGTSISITPTAPAPSP